MSYLIKIGASISKQVLVVGVVLWIFSASAAFAAGTDDFLITVKTDNAGPSADTEFAIPTWSSVTNYNYNIDCNNDSVFEATGVTGAYTCDYTTLGGAGTYQIRIEDNSTDDTGFRRWLFNNGGDRLKLLSVDQWGTIKWNYFAGAFYGAANMDILATDTPDLSGVGSLYRAFTNASNLKATALHNGTGTTTAIGAWDTSTITDMEQAFQNTDAFEPTDLGNWDVGNVTDFYYMFAYNALFNDASINNWNIGENTGTASIRMEGMFRDNLLFNQDLNGWERAAATLSPSDPGSTVSRVINMRDMFVNSLNFNGAIGAWDVGRVQNFYQMFYRNGEMQFNNGDAQGVLGTGMHDWNIGANLAPGQTINMFRMFRGNYHFNQDISGWDVTKVEHFGDMFLDARKFVGTDLCDWNISGSNTHAVNMSNMFYKAEIFNQPLACWQTNAGSTMEHVILTNGMFFQANAFNQPLGDWDLGRVTNFTNMFYHADSFADPAPSISNWRIGQNTGTTEISMANMFRDLPLFNTNLSSWQTHASSTMEYVVNVERMFANSDLYDQPVGDWNVGRVRNFIGMFEGNRDFSDPAPNMCNWTVGLNTGDWRLEFANMFQSTNSFNTPLACWETNTDSTMAYAWNLNRMFNGADAFNQPLGAWDVGRVQSYQYMFANTDIFDDPAPSINTWNIGENTASNVGERRAWNSAVIGNESIDMLGMFQNSSVFNTSLDEWETNADSTMAHVYRLQDMFRNSIFNSPVDAWDVGRVTTFHAMFSQQDHFNQPLNSWNIGENTTIAIRTDYMFWQNDVFNQPLNNWDVSQVNNFQNMFLDTTGFDQSLAAWTPTTGTNFGNMLSRSGMSTANYDDTLISWAGQDLIDGRTLGSIDLEFCASEPFRASLVADQDWIIQGDILDCAPGAVSGAGTLLYWLNAGSHIGSDGDSVETWRDISGDGREFTQTTTASQPTFLNNLIDALNFNPVMRFDGTDDYLSGHDFHTTAANQNLAITTRSASSELTITRSSGTPPVPYDITFSANRSTMGNQFNGNLTTAGSWRPANLPTVGLNTTEYLELDLGSVVPVSTITTKGEGSNQENASWVTDFTVEVSTDGTSFTQVDGVFTGNTDKNTAIFNEFSDSFPARYVRVFPQDWNTYPALRVALGTKAYPAVTTFVLATEEVRQDNITQSINYQDGNNQVSFSVADGAGNATLQYDFGGTFSASASGAVPAADDKPFLTMFSNVSGGDAVIYRNGEEVARNPSAANSTVAGSSFVGGLPVGENFNGHIAEASFLAADLNQDQREKINTYFAIKYNIPISHDYIFMEEGTTTPVVVWDRTARAVYDHDVFGLAVDGEQGLNQKVSSTRDDNDRVLTIATTNNFTEMNSGTVRTSLSGDPAFVVIGNDDGAETLSSLGAPTGYEMLDRRWYPQITGGDQDLHFQFNVEYAGFDIEELSATSDYYFISDTDDDGDFSDETPILLTEGASGMWFNPAAITLEDGQVFTLATDDTAGADVTINQKSGQADPTSVLPLTFTIVFSEPIVTSTFTIADISSASSTAPGVAITGISQVAPMDGTTFEVTATATGNGNVILNIPVGGINDVTGNPNNVSTSTDNVMEYDIALPANPTIDSPTDGSVVTSPTTVTGMCEPGATVHINSPDITPSPTDTTCITAGTYSVPVTINPGVSTLTLTATQTDPAGNTSDSVSTTLEFDEDGDGNPSITEEAGNNGGDGNGDGTQDSEQGDVSGVPNTLTGEYTTLEVSGACTFITQNAVLAEGVLAAQDPGHDYPVGLVDFQVQCTNPGDSADVKIYYGQEYDTSNWEWRKFDSTGAVYSDISSLVTYATSTLGTTTVTTASFTVTDGDPLTDEDGVVDGIINDPSGPAVVIPSSGGGGNGGGGSSNNRVCKDKEASNYNPVGISSPSKCEYDEEESEEPTKPIEELTSNEPTGEVNGDSTLRNLLGGAEPNVPEEFKGEVCTRYMRGYVFPNSINNDPEEVKKLQVFLNEAYGEDLSVDGIYNSDDIEAVKRYQTVHAPQILWPWNLTTPTANVYRTTVTKLNLEMCGYEMDTPYFTEYLGVGDVSLESVRVQDFINLTNSPISGYPTKGLPLTKTYTQATANAVSAYQDRYRKTVLEPWGLTKGTGWWYQTTRSSANALVGTPEPAVTLDNGLSHTAF